MEKYLLDTNIVSDTRKLRPNAGVTSFLSGANENSLYLSVLTLGELRKGIEAKRKIDSRMAKQLSDWVDGIEATFSQRVLGIDIPIARLWGELSAKYNLPTIDLLLAATAMVKDLVLVTRNVKDVKATGVSFLDPSA